jgi:predicted  nucleic acid-binding Zn-ribbon protein
MRFPNTDVIKVKSMIKPPFRTPRNHTQIIIDEASKYFANPLAFYTIRLYNFNMSQSSNLYRLQQIDSQIDQARARVRDIEALLSNNAVLQQAQDHANSTEQSLLDAHKILRKTEEAVQDQRIKINQSESILYGGKVRNPKELQDLQNEVAALKRFNSILEDRQLDAMLALEDLEKDHQKAKVQLAETQAHIAEQQSGLKGELATLLKTVERLEIERNVASTAVIPTDLTLYEQLRQVRHGVAVAKVSSQACGACGSLLTPALVQTAYSPTQLIRCSSCGRILYAG